MAATRRSPKTGKKKSPAKVIPGTIRKITPLRKTKTPTLKTGFRSTRKPSSPKGSTSKPVTPKKGSNIFSRSVIAKTSTTRSKTSSTRSKKSPSLIVGGRTTPRRTTPGRTTPGRTTPGRTTPGRTTPRRGSPGRTTPGRTTPGRTTPGRTTPRRGSPRTLASLKPKTPVKKSGTTVSGKLSERNQFLYISLSICAGLILFVLILFSFYKLYEYFNPSEKSSTDSIDFMEELEDIDEKESRESKENVEATVDEVPDEDKITEEPSEE